MADQPTPDFVNGSSFFGFMGVSLALVLASTSSFIQIWVLLMEQLKPAQESAVSRYGGHR